MSKSIWNFPPEDRDFFSKNEFLEVALRIYCIAIAMFNQGWFQRNDLIAEFFLSFS